jgi:2-C-methyl-D-erythritol 4-phosphate cytidylyltransferase
MAVELVSAAAIVLAGGRGTRMGAAVPDKVWADLGGIPVIAHSLRAFAAAPSITQIVLVARPETARVAGALAPEARVVLGGDRRRDSVAAGLAAIETEIVLIHDGARPLLDLETIETGVRLAREHGAAVPVVPVRDTIKRVKDGRVVESPPRAELFAALTPQCFRTELLRRAHAGSDDDATDDCVLVERLGHPIVAYPGSPRNIKITLPDDLTIAEALLRA